MVYFSLLVSIDFISLWFEQLNFKNMLLLLFSFIIYILMYISQDKTTQQNKTNYINLQYVNNIVYYSYNMLINLHIYYIKLLMICTVNKHYVNYGILNRIHNMLNKISIYYVRCLVLIRKHIMIYKANIDYVNLVCIKSNDMFLNYVNYGMLTRKNIM